MAAAQDPAPRLPPLDPAGFPECRSLMKDRARGPEVHNGMDQEELDAAYTQSDYSTNMATVQRRCAVVAQEVRKRLGEPKRLAYGPSEIEQFDFFPAISISGQAGPPAILVHIHGGAWRFGKAETFSDIAENITRSGQAHLLVADFTNVVDEHGDLRPMAAQVRASLAWAVKNAAEIGGDPERVYVSAHSSGAHLAGAALVADWQAEFGLPQNSLKGALLACGMYDLKGPRLSVRSSYVAFTDEIEEELSTIRHIDRLEVPLVLAYGTTETPEFQRQTWNMANAVRQANKPVKLVRGDGYNHFEMLETLQNPYGVLGRAALEMIGAVGASPS